jgi:hypothetical protein
MPWVQCNMIVMGDLLHAVKSNMSRTKLIDAEEIEADEANEGAE